MAMRPPKTWIVTYLLKGNYCFIDEGSDKIITEAVSLSIARHDIIVDSTIYLPIYNFSVFTDAVRCSLSLTFSLSLSAALLLVEGFSYVL